jgi:hypothetical protein
MTAFTILPSARTVLSQSWLNNSNTFVHSLLCIQHRSQDPEGPPQITLHKLGPWRQYTHRSFWPASLRKIREYTFLLPIVNWPHSYRSPENTKSPIVHLRKDCPHPRFSQPLHDGSSRNLALEQSSGIFGVHHASTWGGNAVIAESHSIFSYPCIYIQYYTLASCTLYLTS